MNIMAGKYMVWPAEALHMSSRLTGKSKKRLISGHAAIDSMLYSMLSLEEFL